MKSASINVKLASLTAIIALVGQGFVALGGPSPGLFGMQQMAVTCCADRDCGCNPDVGNGCCCAPKSGWVPPSQLLECRSLKLLGVQAAYLAVPPSAADPFLFRPTVRRLVEEVQPFADSSRPRPPTPPPRV